MSTTLKLISNSHLVVAHNSYFDRPFLEKYLDKHIPWACSFNDIDWFERGFINSKLELLCIWHGFYFESHRAMSDVDALINLVSHESYKSNTPICGITDRDVDAFVQVLITEFKKYCVNLLINDFISVWV